jgi:hypothetical protein
MQTGLRFRADTASGTAADQGWVSREHEKLAASLPIQGTLGGNPEEVRVPP